MPYTPTTWVFNTTMGTFTRMNNLETQYVEATNSFEQDLFTPFVFSGAVPTKDGSIANQLDIPAYVAFLLQTDNTLRRRATTSTTKVTATPSTTYYLDLNPDGTWSWATSHSGVTGHLTICSVTTDGSGNILAVTDARTISPSWLSGMVGSPILPNFSFGAAVSGSYSALEWIAASHEIAMFTPQSGVANGIAFQVWNGSAGTVPFSIGGQFAGAATYLDASGVLSVKPPNYDAVLTYAINTAYYSSLGTGDTSFGAGAGFFVYDHKNNGFVMSSGTANGISFGGNISGPAGGGIPTTRNGVATSVAVYTGSTTPTGNGTTTPATGALWGNV